MSVTEPFTVETTRDRKWGLTQRYFIGAKDTADDVRTMIGHGGTVLADIAANTIEDLEGDYLVEVRLTIVPYGQPETSISRKESK